MFLLVGSVSAASVTLNASGGDGLVDLHWMANDALTSVQVYRDTDADPAGRSRIAILTGSVRSYTDRAVVNGTTYWYWIKYTDAARSVGNSNVGSATPTATGPAPTPTPVPDNGGAGCAAPTSASLPLVLNGAADTCRVTTGNVSNINSWNTERVEINGVSFTNRWSNQLPAKVNGGYIIHYVGKHPWSHLEVNGSGGSANDPGPQPIVVTGVSVVPATASVNVGATASLTATVQPANARNKAVAWSSSNTAIATVNAAGVVTGVAAGNATITATTADGNRTASSTVTVSKDKPPVANYTIDIGVSGKGGTSPAGKQSYVSGTQVRITATPAQGYIFSGWSGAHTGTTNPLAVTMDGNKSLTANFTAQSGSGADAGLKSLATFPIGVAVNAGSEANSIVSSGTSAKQQAVVLPNFDQMTAGNIMKMSYLHPSEDTFTFNQADDFIGFARSHAMDVHGHTLIWHSDYQVPGFMKNYDGDFAAMLKKHVQTIVTHFQGRVVSWDVVNEALADDGEAALANGLRSTLFSQKMGVSFIDQAFINARAADANVDLFYNDYNTEANGQKTKNLLALVDGMRSRGVPIDGVGFQMHVSVDWPSISAIEASLKAIADRGLKVKITELDVSMRKAYSSFTADAAGRQKQRYHDVVAAYLRAVPAAQRAGIAVWGVWDADSWINRPGQPDWPLLFDANFKPKPALQGFEDALIGK